MVISVALLEEALSLKAHEKMLFIETLINNLDNTNIENNSIWLEESMNRLAKYQAGKSKIYSYEDVLGE